MCCLRRDRERSGVIGSRPSEGNCRERVGCQGQDSPAARPTPLTLNLFPARLSGSGPPGRQPWPGSPGLAQRSRSSAHRSPPGIWARRRGERCLLRTSCSRNTLGKAACGLDSPLALPTCPSWAWEPVSRRLRGALESIQPRVQMRKLRKSCTQNERLLPAGLLFVQQTFPECPLLCQSRRGANRGMWLPPSQASPTFRFAFYPFSQ